MTSTKGVVQRTDQNKPKSVVYQFPLQLILPGMTCSHRTRLKDPSRKERCEPMDRSSIITPFSSYPRE
nr:hypothetical protein Q903MT_gene1316 [Picea sitchensis]